MVDECNCNCCLLAEQYQKFMLMFKNSVIQYHMLQLIYKRCKIIKSSTKSSSCKIKKFVKSHKRKYPLVTITCCELINPTCDIKIIESELERINASKNSFVLIKFKREQLVIERQDAMNVLIELIQFISKIGDEYVLYNGIRRLHVWVNSIGPDSSVFSYASERKNFNLITDVLEKIRDKCSRLYNSLNFVTDNEGFTFASSHTSVYEVCAFKVRELINLINSSIARYQVIDLNV